MLRATGILALVLTSVLTVLIFSRVKTVRAAGHFSNTIDPSPNAPLTSSSSIHLETQGGTMNMFSGETAPAYPGDFGYVTSGDIVVNVYVAIPELPRQCDIEIVHRWVGFQGRMFGSTEIEYAGKGYPIERSVRAFLGMLALTAAAPTLLWGLVALPWLCLLRRPRPLRQGNQAL